VSELADCTTIGTRPTELACATSSVLARIDLDGDVAIERAMRLLGERWGARALTYRACPADGGYAVEHVHASGWMESSALADEIARYASTSRDPFPVYDPLRPEASQRDVVRTFRAIDYHGTELGVFNRRIGLGEGEQMRALVCDGPLLLAWVGASRAAPFTRVEREELTTLLPAFRERLRLERQLSSATFSPTLLAAAIEELPVPAFLVETRHLHLELANAPGCALAARLGRALPERIREARAGAKNGFRVVSVVVRGLSEHALVLFDGDGPCVAPTTRARLARAARELTLTPRQQQVLAEIVAGQPNKVIAERLRCSVRAVEVHVTALLRKARVDSRAALVGRVLGADA
jgi:DNA-binding CsgD family transcriptional regulator